MYSRSLSLVELTYRKRVRVRDQPFENVTHSHSALERAALQRTNKRTSARTNERTNERARGRERHKTSLPYRRAETLLQLHSNLAGPYPTSMHRHSYCMHIFVKFYLAVVDGFGVCARVCLSVCCTLSVFVASLCVAFAHVNKAG